MSVPLADRIRPSCISDMVGQEHILKEGKLLRKLIESNNIPNLIFYGPPGTGKTTLAKIISKKTNKTLHKLNATNASIQDLKDIFSQIDTFVAPNGILLYLDEIQYFNKKQQQSLLEFIENGKVTLIASTTENPYFYIYNALLSRATVFEFKSVPNNEIIKAIKNAGIFLEKETQQKVIIEDSASRKIARLSGGDVRRAINFVELCFFAVNVNDIVLINSKVVDDLSANAPINYDKNGDEHYDLLSAFQKSLRGSDPDAAVFYLAKLLECGELLSSCRRLMICACEDVGLAYPQIIPIVKSSVDIALQVGNPEAKIPLANAALLVSLAPKSNSAYLAINKATEEIQSGYNYPIPRHLKNVHFDGADVKENVEKYNYAHDFENHWVKQSYLPDELISKKYYFFGENKIEQSFKNYWDKVKNKQ